MDHIYLDNAASTRASPAVIRAMSPYLDGEYGNPSSLHRYGRLAARAVRTARAHVAGLVNARSHEIVFTSGGTESDNTALCGVDGGRIIISSIEHDAILEPCRHLPHTVDHIPVDSDGLILLDELERMLSDDVVLVSVMLANNEVGTVQPIPEVSRMCHARGIIVHTDAVQAAGKTPLDVSKLGVDMMSLSSHKINGPKGVGALFVRAGTSLAPAMRGGGQEMGMRSGTENVASIVGFGEACREAKANLEANMALYSKLWSRMVRRVLEEIPLSNVNGHPTTRIKSNVHMSFAGVGGEDLVTKLDEYGVAASTGSACSVNRQKESHVLRAMGMPREQISGSLRLTFGPYTTISEVDRAVDILKSTVVELRRFSPLKERYGF